MSQLVFDTSDFDMRLDLYDERVRKAAMQAMRDNGNDLLKESKKLVAKDEGTLERSGTTETHVTAVFKSAIETTVSFNTPYANKVHEEMQPQGDRIKPGETTRMKPPTEFGPAGGGYLIRPLTGKARRYAQHLADAVKAATS